MVSWTKEGDVHLPVETWPASQTAVERQRGRVGVRGSTGNWGVPSPPFYSRVSHPTLSPCRTPSPRLHPICTAGTIMLPSTLPAGPMIPHFLLNATPSALSILTSQHPLQGNGKWGETYTLLLLLIHFKLGKKYKNCKCKLCIRICTKSLILLRTAKSNFCLRTFI